MVKMNRVRQLGQGMTEYIIIVALIAIAAIGVYKAFGGVVRGQTAVAATALAGEASTASRTATNEAKDAAGEEGEAEKGLGEFEN